MATRVNSTRWHSVGSAPARTAVARLDSLAGSMPIRHSRSSRPPSPAVSSLEATRSVSSGPTGTELATTRGHCCVPIARVQPVSALRMAETHKRNRRLVVSRELSALAFNARVLHEARDSRTPLLDRFKFLGIVSSNIDEFFGVRVSGIREQIDAGVQAASADGRSPTEQMRAIREAAALLMLAAQGAWRELTTELSNAGLSLVEWEEIDHATQEKLTARFKQEIFPVLTPLAIDPGHPFPYVSSLSLSLAVQLHDAERGERFFARVKVPQILGRLVQIGDGRAILLEDLIRAHIELLFVGHEIAGAYAFRITRDADIEVEEGEADDLLAAIEEELRQRRFGKIVRVEIEAAAPAEVRQLLLAGFELQPDALSDVDGVLDLTVSGEIAALQLPDLHSPTWHPVTPPRIAEAPRAADGGADLFRVIQQGDLLAYLRTNSQILK